VAVGVALAAGMAVAVDAAVGGWLATSVTGVIRGGSREVSAWPVRARV